MQTNFISITVLLALMVLGGGGRKLCWGDWVGRTTGILGRL